ncbi:MAG TPA: TssQ family T6SS-associated lipoprotein [Burkholderiaceae bacterium]|nr:TssQ family T6SS-associated lipoprotein [Burkholderiaceae bacterium]
MSAASTLRVALVLAAAALVAACQPTPTTASIAELYQRPAERALVDGIRLYDGGEFERAEATLRAAVAANLVDHRDEAIAYKYLAFIACAFNRGTECALDFTNAFKADPDFRLNDVEIGHPLWGPVYRRVAQALGHPDSRTGAPAGAPGEASRGH